MYDDFVVTVNGPGTTSHWPLGPGRSGSLEIAVHGWQPPHRGPLTSWLDVMDGLWHRIDCSHSNPCLPCLGRPFSAGPTGAWLLMMLVQLQLQYRQTCTCMERYEYLGLVPCQSVQGHAIMPGHLSKIRALLSQISRLLLVPSSA